jgi:hypothetical protein
VNYVRRISYEIEGTLKIYNKAAAFKEIKEATGVAITEKS